MKKCEQKACSDSAARGFTSIAIQTVSCCLLLIALLACNEPEEITSDVPGIADESYLNEDGEARKIPSYLRLKEFIGHSNQHYVFYYNERQHVDSIVTYFGEPTTTYTYRVRYNGERIDSVVFRHDSGLLISYHTNFQYDTKGRIIQYTYYGHMPGEPDSASAKTFYIAYDRKGRITSINGLQFTYNGRNDIVKWFSSPNEFIFTYNDSLNPLYYIPNLFALLIEDRHYWENMLSKHNPEMKIYPTGAEENPGDSEKLYLYEYDSRGRVVHMWTYWNHYGETVDDYRFIYME